jgi:hypothetical protein
MVHVGLTLALLCLFVSTIAIATIRHARRMEQSSKPDDVTASLQKLLRTQDITPEVYTCPATQPSQWEFGNPAGASQDWSKGTAKVLSYRYQNPFATQSSSPGSER